MGDFAGKRDDGRIIDFVKRGVVSVLNFVSFHILIKNVIPTT